MTERSDLRAEIDRLRQKHGARIVAHNYCRGDVQDVADFVGDSLQLSVKAREAKAAAIVFCGVRFMAETAKILSPNSIVLLPVADAGCPMADMASGEAVAAYRRDHPDALLVAYVNSTAAVKAEVDWCVTSANAARIVAKLPTDREILFLPDRNLGANVNVATGRRMACWDGCCPVHDRVTVDAVRAAKAAHPGAPFYCHPECRPEVCALADAALSTGGMLAAIRDGEAGEAIVGTETGILHRLRKDAPGKKLYALEPEPVCVDMKKIRVEDVLAALRSLDAAPRGKGFAVDLDPALMDRARIPIERMLSASEPSPVSRKDLP